MKKSRGRLFCVSAEASSPAGTIHLTIRERAHVLTHMFYATETKTCIPDNRNNFRFHVAFLLQTGYCRKSLYPLQAGNDPEENARGDDVAIIQKNNTMCHSLHAFFSPKIMQQSG